MNARVIREAMSPILLLVAIVGLIAAALGLLDCAPRADEPTLPAYCFDEKLLLTAYLRCVDKSPTLAESKECRATVNKVCGITETRSGAR